MNSANIIIVGTGGHAYVVQDICTALNRNVLGYIDPSIEIGTPFNNHTIIGHDEYWESTPPSEDLEFIVAIGNQDIRQSIVRNIENHHHNFACLIHPSAIVSPSAEIGQATVIMPNVVVNARARIGRNCILNTSSVIEHDVILHDHVHISPGAVLTGGTICEETVHIGANATILTKIKIENNAIVGAGSVVTKQVQSNTCVVGNPAKILDQHAS